MVEEVLTPPAAAEVIETCGGRVWLDNGIVHEAVDVAHLELEHVQCLAKGVRALVGEHAQALLLADLCGVRSASSDARAYSSSAELRALVGAQAFVVTSPVTRVIASFFVRVFHPPFPVRLFAGPAPASAWLHGLRPAMSA